MNNQDIFEVFMVEIGQWKRTKDGIEMFGPHISTGEIRERYNSWLKNKS